MANKISHFTQTVNGISTTYDIHDANAVPRSGGVVLSGTDYSRTVDNSVLNFNGGTAWNKGAQLQLFGSNSGEEAPGAFILYATPPNTTLLKDRSRFQGNPNGTLTWNGQPIQYASDARLKQQITEIDDKLLDAWESVEPSQFKYNDAVSEKGTKARLHTGYVVQQIDNACKSHGVDVSEYGLYCHEEYPQETEEVEVEQKDGTKTKETKVIREASEHYSLRYTEVYAVECMYLRRCIARLTARIEQLEKEQEAGK